MLVTDGTGVVVESGWSVAAEAATGDGSKPMTEAGAAVQAYFAGDFDALAGIRFVAAGTAFQERVWDALLLVPVGTTTSYGRLAAKIGLVTGARAVGGACGANPIGLIVPCHRVVGTTGSLTGYGSGVDRKRRLLDHEAGHRAPRWRR